MKKALAILLALSMVFAAFADEPATNYSVAEFKGSAELGWKTNLDAESNGFFNSTEANLKLNLLNGGSKATSGDGVWGELEIKIDTPDALGLNADKDTNLVITKTVSVEKAKIHFVEGDFGVALNIKTPSLELAENYNVNQNPDSIMYDAYDKYLNDAITTAEKNLAALLLDDTSSPEAVLDVEKEIANLKAEKKAMEDLGNPGSLKNGFAVEVTTAVADVNVKVMDNGVVANDAKEYGFGADISVKAIENATLKAAIANAYENTAVTASADYKFAIDDTLFVKPAVDFKMFDAKDDAGDKKALSASVVFGWGDKADPDFLTDGGRDAKGENDTRFVGNGIDTGVKVSYSTDLKDNKEDGINVKVYDGSLVEGLKVGAEYDAKLSEIAKGTVSFAAKYGTDIDILTIGLDFGVRTDLDTKTTFYGYKVAVSTDDIIDNTNLYVNYQAGDYKSGAKDAMNGKHEKGIVTLGAKISL